jgi:large subunit ribosomal protein L9
MIELILKDEVEHLGERGDIVKVAPGYARNYLLPRKLAVAVTAGNRKQIEYEKKIAAAKAAEARAVAQALATRFAQVEVLVTRKAGENQQLFGSVTAADIAEALAAQGFDVDKRRIQLRDPIKQVGEQQVPVKLHRDVTASVKVVVAAENPPAATVPAGEGAEAAESGEETAGA